MAAPIHFNQWVLQMETRRIISPNILKIVFGVAVVAVAYKMLPLLDLLNMFFYVVLVPLALLGAVGLVSSGTYNLIREATVGWTYRLREKVDEELQKLRAHAAERVVVSVEPKPQPAAST